MYKLNKRGKGALKTYFKAQTAIHGMPEASYKEFKKYVEDYYNRNYSLEVLYYVVSPPHWDRFTVDSVYFKVKKE